MADVSQSLLKGPCTYPQDIFSVRAATNDGAKVVLKRDKMNSQPMMEPSSASRKDTVLPEDSK